MKDHNCPFYGRHMYIPQVTSGGRPFPFILMSQGGNQCALVINSYAPCWMETHNQPIDWKQCPLVKDIRLEPHD